MTNLMRARHLHLYSLRMLIVISVFAAFSWTAVSAADTASVVAQQGNCQVTGKAGWLPYLIQTGDTLDSLAARAETTVAELMAINCLKTETLAVGDLILTPKLGPALPTATPTTVPTAAATTMPTTEIAVEEMPTEAVPAATEAATSMPTATPLPTEPLVTVLEESIVTATEESAGDTEQATNSQAATDSTPDAPAPTATIVPTATPAAEATEEPAAVVSNSNGTPPSATPLGPNTLIMISLLIMGAVSALFFALQPRPRQKIAAVAVGQVPAQRAAWGGNFAFLVGGFVVGVVVFPMIQIPTFTTIPTWLSAGAAIGLIALLAVKEVLLGAIEWRGLNRVLNLGIAPLLMIFLLSVATRFAGIIH
ncbi:MAG: LysM peptidoglycan-binding domain-containing protein [Caldilineaceae bacterium]|nr:LysM peptidoglycan-binding domain-containing protein [Caldilineaceae bacterium]